jgi:hypothetical protein
MRPLKKSTKTQTSVGDRSAYGEKFTSQGRRQNRLSGVHAAATEK